MFEILPQCKQSRGLACEEKIVIAAYGDNKDNDNAFKEVCMYKFILWMNKWFPAPTVFTNKTNDELFQMNYEKGKYYFRHFNRFLPLEEKSILEVGCGDGGIVKAFGERSKCIGIDIFERRDEKGRPMLEKNNINYKIYDGKQFPFPDNHFDIVCSFATMEHFSDPDNVLKEMKRVLKNEGKILISFAPFYYPLGSHLYRYIFIPWCHIIFPKKSLLKAYHKLSGRWYPFDRNLNKMSHKRFMGMIASTELQIFQINIIPIGKTNEKRASAARLLKYPYIRELFINRIEAVVEK